jgi:hypothetical protein
VKERKEGRKEGGSKQHLIKGKPNKEEALSSTLVAAV